MKLALAIALSLCLLAAACGGPGAATPTVPFTTSSPNMPTDATRPAIAAWILEKFTITPNPARAGEPVEVWVNAYMVDFLITFLIARLEVNGAVVEQARWMLYIDESTPFHFTYTPPAPGTYDITVSVNLEENETSYGPQSGESMSVTESGTLVVT